MRRQVRRVAMVRANLPTSVIQRLNLFHTGAKEDFSSRLADALYQPVVELLKATAQVAKVGGTIVKSCPEPWKSNLVVHRSKFGNKQWLEHHAVGTSTHPSTQPWLSGFALIR